MKLENLKILGKIPEKIRPIFQSLRFQSLFQKRQKDGEKPESSEHDELSLDYPLANGGDDQARYTNGLFLNSVEQLSEEDIPLSPAAAGKKESKGIVRRVLFCFFAATFVISCGMLVYNLLSKQKALQIYSQLEQEFFSTGFDFDINSATLFEPADDGEVKRLMEDAPSSSLGTMTERMEAMEAALSLDESGTEKKEYNEELEKMRASLRSLAQINPDIYGWISIEGTQINYPLVQGTDNDYYLDHAYTGDYLPEGSIFVDSANNKTIMKNYNTVIYGHNITSGTMFHDVTKFFRDAYMNGVYIYIYTYDGVFIYEPFSIYESRYDYNYFRTGFTGSDAFLSFAEEVLANSTGPEKEMTFTENDRMITLSTCTNIIQTQRYALHAKLIKYIVD